MPLSANPWLRLCAWLFDTSLASLPAAALAAVATLPAHTHLMELAPQALEKMDAVVTYLKALLWVMGQQAAFFLTFLMLIYGIGSVLAESGFHQATWGKRLMGLQVQRDDGQDMTRALAAQRFMAGGLGWLSMNVGHAMGQFRPDHRMLHDLVTKTRVVVDSSLHRKRGIAWCLGAWMGTALLLSWLSPTDPVVVQLLNQAALQQVAY